MLRKVLYIQNRSLVTGRRCIYSGRAPQLLSKTSFESTTSSDDTKKEGYGEKEICLLGPIDIRAPLPGNIGVPPLSMFNTAKIQQLPKPAGEKCEILQTLLPQERHQMFLTQVACLTAEEALSESNQLECSGYTCPQLLKKDFLDLFPYRDLTNDNLTVVTFCRKTENDMSTWSETAEEERGKLERCFVEAAEAICAHLKRSAYWADFIHPNSGKPHLGPLTSATMFETDIRYRHFGFNIEDLGCCKIISHHEWGTNIFVGAIFTNASLDSREVQGILKRNNTEILDFSNVIF